MDYSHMPANSAVGDGLQKLTAAREVTVRKNNVCGAAEYSVLEGEERVLLEAREDADCCAVICISYYRSFVIHLFDEIENQVFTFRRSSNFFLEEMKVYDARETLVCVVSQAMSLVGLLLHISDEVGRPVLRVKGGFMDLSSYKLQTADKTEIGVIGREPCSYPSVFYARFPANLAVSYKAAVIGSCILLDFIRARRHATVSSTI